MFNLRSLRWMLVLTVLAVLTFAAPLAQAKPPSDGYLPGCIGEYYNNTSFSGLPSLVRTDPQINFFWREYTSPGPGINVNNYSVRWNCSVFVQTAGTYNFNVVTDDGMNLLLDGNPLLWAWYDQGPTAYAVSTNVTAGWHTLRVEYYNRTLGGTAQVSSNLITTPPPPTITDWKGDYYNNPTLSGAPLLTRNDASIDFSWGTGSPAPGMPADRFSVRWTRTINFAPGTYRFTVTADDGVRVWIDNVVLVDRWIDQPSTTYTVDAQIAAGNHVVMMEYYENGGGATAKLSYSLITSPPVSGWQGQYFNNLGLSGAPVLTRTDAAVNFNWGEGAPAAGLPADMFSVRWDSTQNIATAGNYSISATSDDGVRVWVDGVMVIDGWYDHPPLMFVTTRNLTAGAHAVRVEYYERSGGAMVQVQIAPATPPPPPTGELLIDDQSAGWQAGGTTRMFGSSLGIGNHSFWTYNNSYTARGYNWARWYAQVATPGYYEVFAYIPDNLGTTLNARYWVFHNNRYDLATRRQGFYNNQWMSLGTYYFSGGGSEYVSLADVTYECQLCRTVAFDAIKLVPR